MHFYNHKILLTTFLLAVAAMVSCGKKEDASKKKNTGPRTLNAEGYVVRPQTYSNVYIAGGSLLPNEQISILPEVAGRVTDILFKEGTHVRKGQVLVQLNDVDIKAQIQKLRAQRQLQVKTLERQKELVDIGGISKQDYETTQTQIASIDADIAYNEAQLRKFKIVAPFDGTIGIRGISVGAIVGTTTVVTTLQQVNNLKMDFNIPDQYKDMLQVNKEVLFTVDGRLDTLAGKISAFDPGADATTRNIKVRAIVPNSDNKLTAGAFAHVLINFTTDNNAILIPSQAVIPTTKDKKVAVLKGGKANLVTITIGDRTEDKVQVLKGLQSGDTIITTGIMQVKPGMDVKVGRLRS